MSQQWFMPATPVLSNGGTGSGLPISCYLNAVEDSLESIFDTWQENGWLGAKGGGIGTYWGDVRGIGEQVKGAGQTSGIIPFIHVMDSLTLAISQGSKRRGAGAVYVDVHHPEVEEFLEIRKQGGDDGRKALNLHHGLCVTDEFMVAVRDGDPFDLRSPKTGETTKTVDARALWQKILETRLQTGEPYLLFTDTVNAHMSPEQRELGLRVRQSNLCSEITLHTGVDHLGVDRTAVCCLASVNAEHFLLWREDPKFVEDVMRFLDNVLQDFIDHAPDVMEKARYSAHRERAVGLGLMGFHSFLQKQGVPFESVMAKSWNMRLFKHLRLEADTASLMLGAERGAYPDFLDAHGKDGEPPERFSHKLAVAPTATISIICGGTSAGIEPIPANIYNAKTLSGTFAVRNQHLDSILRDYAGDMRGPDALDQVEAWWSSILEHEGSVQHLGFLSEIERDTFKTAFEIDQRWIVELAADRTDDVCQATSVNLFIPGDVDKWDLHMLHFGAWEQGCKSLYYLRSKSIQRAAFAGSDAPPPDYDECLTCQ
jgi:ribonucleoside-diphosphate reductase alpha chain